MMPVDNGGCLHLEVRILNANVLLRLSLSTLLSCGEQNLELFAVCLKKFYWQSGTRQGSRSLKLVLIKL